jgi:serine/threonine protein kinase
MNKRLLSGLAGSEPIPGYVLRKRLGSGGYGEVWLADAPGGLRKAVKLIFGNSNETRASSELKSLERIRRASHPFLLSIERIEVVEGRVIIVTELAESSLQDRFEFHRRQGSPGIPRGELLEFLRDAADALDFLAQKHSLQHLDVKPGNLLIIAERIKVADFGLVKDLHDSNQSLVGGLTPTYSAPELFDGRPTFRSDQYSLALVFMQMLTGRLPFRGTTAGELARQHLSLPPDLDPLPPADRPAVLRALSKNPLDRFATCRQFIDYLMKVRGSALPVPDPNKEIPNNGVQKNAGEMTSEANTKRISAKQYFVHSAIPLQDLASQWVQSRCMFIGIGGQGLRALQALRNDLDANVDDRYCLEDHEWLALDTDWDDCAQVAAEESDTPLPLESLFHLPIHSPHHYRKYPIERFEALSRRWLYNIPRTLKTEGVRPIATLSLIANYQPLRTVIENKLKRLLKEYKLEQQGDCPLKVYVLASLHGGTGSGLVAEVGMLIRNAMQNLGFPDYRLTATVSLAAAGAEQHGANLQIANGLVALSELTHWMDPGREKPNIQYEPAGLTSNSCPFDWVTLIDGGLLGDPESTRLNPRNLARQVSLDCQTLLSAALGNSRIQAKSVSDHGWLRHSTDVSIQDISDVSPESIAQWCCVQSLRGILTYFVGSSRLVDQGSRSATEASLRSSLASQLPLSDKACEEYVQRVLQELDLTPPAADSENRRTWSERWKQRLSDDGSTRARRRVQDLSSWQNTLGQTIDRRVYGWPCILQIHERLLDTLRRAHSEQLPSLSVQLHQHLGGWTSTDSLRVRCGQHLESLIEDCQRLFNGASHESQLMVQRYHQWWSALGEDPSLVSLCKVDLHGLPELIQQVASAAKTRLESILLAPLQRNLRTGLRELDPTGGSFQDQPRGLELEVEELHSYSKMLLAAHEIITQMMADAGLTADMFSQGDYHFKSIPMEALPDLEPTLCSGGGEIFRIVFTPDQESTQVSQAIDAMGLRPQTTLLPSTASQGVQALCDAVHLNIPSLVTSLWHPSGSTLDLAERLRTRVDMDWDAVSTLLDANRTQPSLAGEGASCTDRIPSPPPESTLGAAMIPVLDTPAPT